jgi:hypothetical protein
LASVRFASLLSHNVQRAPWPSGRTHQHDVEEPVAASTEILIGDADAQHVLIRPLSRSSPGLFDDGDGNWIDCEVQITAGAFSGRLGADIRPEEFQSFLEQLEAVQAASEGTASVTATDGQLAMAVTAVDGGVRVSGEAFDRSDDGNRLQFAFDLEAGGLPEIARSLQHVLQAFPVTDDMDTTEPFLK